MKYSFRRSALAAAAYSLLSHSSWAQSLDDVNQHHLDEVTITARSLEGSNLLVPAQQLSGAALAQRQGTTLGEILDNLPGIANSSFGPNVGRPVIRGMDGDRIRILQNSGSNLDISAMSPDHAVPIDPLTTERIEILRGPAALLYGGSAIGGVVNVIDNRISRERTFDAQGGAIGKFEARAGGAANEQSTGALLEAGNDRFVIHVDAFDRKTQNLRVPKELQCNGTFQRRICNSASESRGAAVGGTLLFDRGYLGLSTSEYKSTYGTVAEPTVTIGMLRRHHTLEGKLREVGGIFQDVKFQFGRTAYTHTEYDGAEAGTKFDNKGFDFRLEGAQNPLRLSNGNLLEGTIGLESESNALQALGLEKFVGPSRTQNSAIFAYQALKTTWGQLSAGARKESVSVQLKEDFGTNLAQTKKFNPVSFSLGVMRNLRQGDMQDGWQIKGNLSASQRAPKDYELFAEGEHVATNAYEKGRASIGLEKGTQIDIGGEWKNGVNKFSLTGFESRFSNFIALRPTGEDVGGLPVYQFQGVEARLYGVESTAKIRMVGGQQALISQNASHGAMDLELRADFVKANDLTNKQPLPRIAPMRLGADLVWSKNAWGARFGFVHSAAQNRVPAVGQTTGVTTASHTLWNAGLNYHTHKGATHWMMFAKLDNITDKLAYSSTSVLTQTMGSNAPPIAGRSLKIGLQASF